MILIQKKMNTTSGISMIQFNHMPGLLTYFCNIVMAVTVIVGIIANVSVGICILQSKSLRTYINANLVSSSVVNVFGCVVLVPLRIYVYSVPRVYNDVRTICDVAIFFRTLCDSVQFFMLCSASFERYQCVANPFKKSGRARRTAVFITVSWVVAFILSTVSVLAFEDSTLYDTCYDSLSVFQISWGYHDVLLIFPLGMTSLIIIFVFYGLIIQTLYKHSIKMHSHTRRKGNKTAPLPKDIEKSINTECSATILVSNQMNSQKHDLSKAEQDIRTQNSNKKASVKIDNYLQANQTSLENESHIDQHTNTLSINYTAEQHDLCVLTQPSSISQPSTSGSHSMEVLQVTDNVSSKVINDGDYTDSKITRQSKSNSSNIVNLSISKQHVIPEVKAYDIDGSVHTIKIEGKTHIAGAVCVMNSKNREQGKRRVEVRAAKRIAITIGVFLVCWLPLPLAVICTFSYEMHSNSFYNLVMICSVIGTTAVAINPILHTLLNKQLKGALKAMLKCKKCTHYWKKS